MTTPVPLDDFGAAGVKVWSRLSLHVAAGREQRLGYVYLRTNREIGAGYVGQAVDHACFLARQQEHNLKLGAFHSYSTLGRAKPGAALDVLEETMIRQQGGIRR